jgi:predicted nuclease with TOPRIM domain
MSDIDPISKRRIRADRRRMEHTERLRAQVATLKSENEDLVAAASGLSGDVTAFGQKIEALEAENEQLRGKVGELEAKLHKRTGHAVDAITDLHLRAEAAEAQLATARREAWEECREAAAKAVMALLGENAIHISARNAARDIRELPNPYAEKEPGT